MSPTSLHLRIGMTIENTEQPQTGCVDGDIAGAGTRISLYLTLGYLIPRGLLGFWAKKAICNRDVPGGLLLLNLCLSIAMCFQLFNGKLSFGDAIIGSMVVDAQGTALLGTLALRDVLRARVHVIGIYLSAFFTLVVMCIFISTVSRKNRPATVFKVSCADSVHNTGGQSEAHDTGMPGGL
jgi:hypothetical protein